MKKSVETQIKEQVAWFTANLETPTKARLGKRAYKEIAVDALKKADVAKKVQVKKIATDDVQLSKIATSAGSIRLIRDLTLPEDAVVVE